MGAQNREGLIRARTIGAQLARGEARALGIFWWDFALLLSTCNFGAVGSYGWILLPVPPTCFLPHLLPHILAQIAKKLEKTQEQSSSCPK
jgi:hypothetical protein